MKKTILVLGMLAFVAAGCNTQNISQPTSEGLQPQQSVSASSHTNQTQTRQNAGGPDYTPSTQPLTWKANDAMFTVTQKQISAVDQFSVDSLVSGSTECGTSHSKSYYQSLLSKLNNQQGVQYTFKYIGAHQGGDTFTATVLPNVFGYKNLINFKNDFDICSLGGDLYPDQVSAGYLLFVSSSGGGVKDGSNLPEGTAAIASYVEPTFKIK